MLLRTQRILFAGLNRLYMGGTRMASGPHNFVVASACALESPISPRFLYPSDLLNREPAASAQPEVGSRGHELKATDVVGSSAAYQLGVQGQLGNPGSKCSVGADASDGMVWWLVYTKSRQEKRLSQQLCEMRVAHYLPVHKREAVTRGRVRLVEEPLFSGYIFLHADDAQRRKALATNRISATHPVSDGDRLRGELKQIAQAISAGARLTLEAQIEPGDWVRVRSGAYEGLEGVVLRRKNKSKLQLSVNFLKRGASLELPDCLLEVIDPPYIDESAAVEIVGRRGL